MNLRRAQELEQLKAEKEKLWQKVKRKRQQLKDATLNKACQDFRSYFREQGFSIEEGEVNDHYNRPHFQKQIVATYGKIRVVLSIPDYNVPFMGARSIFQLDITGSNEGHCTIAINELGASSRVSISPSPRTAEERLEKDFKEEKERIEELQKELENFDQIKLGFKAVKERKTNQNTSKVEFPIDQFESFREFLEAVFEA